MRIDYNFIPEGKLEEEKQRKLVSSYAGKLLEVCGARTLVITLDNEDRLKVAMSEQRLVDAFDFELEE